MTKKHEVSDIEVHNFQIMKGAEKRGHARKTVRSDIAHKFIERIDERPINQSPRAVKVKDGLSISVATDSVRDRDDC